MVKRMKKENLLIGLFSFILFLFTVSPIDATIPDIVLKQKKAVVTIYINDKDGNQVATGSGFVIDPNGIIATNFHIVSKWLEADNTILFKMENGSFYPVEALISFDEDNDVALLKVSGKELLTIKLATGYETKQGESVVVIGSPLGLETTVSDGIISSIRGKGGIIQITAPISPGSSGSPVFNSKGEVIGVATFLIKEGQNLNFAIPVRHVTKLLYDYKTQKKTERNVVESKPSEAPSPVSTPTPMPDALFPEARFEKADALFSEKKYEDALEEYLHLMIDIFRTKEDHPKIPHIKLRLGECYILNGEDMRGWYWLKSVIKEHPNSVEAFLAKNEISSRRWFRVGKTDKIWFIDVTSITPLDNNGVRVLVKTQGGTMGLNSSVTNEVYDCALGRTALLGAMDYDANGKVTRSADFSNDITWNTVSPDSIGEAIWKAVCGKE